MKHNLEIPKYLRSNLSLLKGMTDQILEEYQEKELLAKEASALIDLESCLAKPIPPLPKILLSEIKGYPLGFIAEEKHVTDLLLHFQNLECLPKSIGNLTKLETLWIGDNKLCVLPPSIGHLKNLQILDLGSNQLASLPPSVENLTNLRSLILAYNKLFCLPNSFGNLINLEYLDLKNNQLSYLPENFGQLTNLKTLHLDNNSLTSLPKSFGELTSLERLNLWKNRLKSLPENFGELLKLNRLFLEDNSFQPNQATVFSLLKIFLTNNSLITNRVKLILKSFKGIMPLIVLFLIQKGSCLSASSLLQILKLVKDGKTSQSCLMRLKPLLLSIILSPENPELTQLATQLLK